MEDSKQLFKGAMAGESRKRGAWGLPKPNLKSYGKGSSDRDGDKVNDLVDCDINNPKKHFVPLPIRQPTKERIQAIRTKAAEEEKKRKLREEFRAAKRKLTKARGERYIVTGARAVGRVIKGVRKRTAEYRAKEPERLRTRIATERSRLELERIRQQREKLRPKAVGLGTGMGMTMESMGTGIGASMFGPPRPAVKPIVKKKRRKRRKKAKRKKGQKVKIVYI